MTDRCIRSLLPTGWLLAVLVAIPATGFADMRIASASNFTPTLTQLIERYQTDNPELRASISNGSSGKHYAQIRQGAPFDVFFSADDQRTADLVTSGHALPDSRAPYALGRLVLWSADPALIPDDGLTLLRNAEFRRLAIANPRVAPYGAAAQHLLDSAGIELQRGQLVTGQSIGQAFNFVLSGNAELGFLAASQVILHDRAHSAGSMWTPAPDQYPPIIQEVVILESARDKDAAVRLLHWIHCSPHAQAIIEADGYRTPTPEATAC